MSDNNRFLKSSHMMYEELIQSLDEIFVSIVIVNYNGENYLKDCLQSVFNTDAISYEVIVVDNASTDESVDWLNDAHPQVRTIALKSNIGFGRANHVGVEEASGSIIAFLNCDTIVTPAWLWRLVKPLCDDSSIGATCSTLLFMDRPEMVNARGGGMTCVGLGFDRDFGCYAGQNYTHQTLSQGRLRETFFPTAAAMAMRKDEFKALGFDSAMFMYHEDVDLGWRIWLSGKRVVNCESSIVLHKYGGTSAAQKGLSQRHIMGNRHNLRSLWKNYERRNALRMTVRLFLLWHKDRAYRTMLLALSWNVMHMPGTWSERKKSQKTRCLSDDELAGTGLITEPVRPPTAPKMQVIRHNDDLRMLLPCPTLRPGVHSGAGRLGPGWHARPQSMDGVPVLATSGKAVCHLRQEPNAAGELHVCLHVPKDVPESFLIAINCNGEKLVCQPARETWTRFALPVVTDQDGLLRVELESPVWKQFDATNIEQWQFVGCLVREFSFVIRKSSTEHVDHHKPNASVIIPAYNRSQILELCLQAMQQQDCHNFEVIVVDDGSTDRTWELLNEWKRKPLVFALTILRQKNSGPGQARNLALRHAVNDIVIFIGDDIIVSPDFVRLHLERHSSGSSCHAVVGHTDWDRERMRVTSCLEHVNQAGQQFGYGLVQDGCEVPYTFFYTSNISLPRSVLGPAPFDPAFEIAAWEDVDVGFRLQRRGLRIVYAAEIKARHLHPMSLRDYYQRQRAVGTSIKKLYALRPELAQDKETMPHLNGKQWIGLLHIAAQPVLMALNLLDRGGGNIPPWLLNMLLAVAFYKGVREGS